MTTEIIKTIIRFRIINKEIKEGIMNMKKVCKRILALGLAVVMVLSYQVPAMAAQSGVTGSGTKENPYKISSAAGLSVLNQKDQYIYAQLENNIDLSQGTLMEGRD